jgi:hypothetical protein
VTSGGVIQVTLAQPATIDMVVLQLLPAVQRHGTDIRAQGSTAATGPSPLGTPRTRRVGVVALGRRPAGHITIHWNRRVHGHRLTHGRYLLLLQSRVGHRLVDVSDAVPLRIG